MSVNPYAPPRSCSYSRLALFLQWALQTALLVAFCLVSGLVAIVAANELIQRNCTAYKRAIEYCQVDDTRASQHRRIVVSARIRWRSLLYPRRGKRDLVAPDDGQLATGDGRRGRGFGPVRALTRIVALDLEI